MPKTVFSDGTEVAAAWFNAQQAILFDGQDIDGHYPPIADNDLSNAPGNIKPEWQSFRDTLRVSAGTGLAANYQAGAILLPSGAIATISAGSIVVADNATSIIFVDRLGTVAVAAAAAVPVQAFRMAQVVAGGGTISSIVDLRSRFAIGPRAEATNTLGGSGEEGDLTLNSSTTLARGVYSVRNLTVATGATITVPAGVQIFCSGTANIQGNIVVSPATPGGGSVVAGSNSIFLIATGPAGGGIAPGSGFAGGQPYPFTFLQGSGGSGGRLSGTGNVGNLAAGGNGGGGFVLEAAGAIAVSGTISAAGGNGGEASDTSGTGEFSGGGGGSGGLIWLRSIASISVSAAATLDVRGGNGGGGITNGLGGSGGGGGYVVLNAPTVSNSGTILLSGGAAGSNGGAAETPTYLRGGAGGGFGGAGGSCPSAATNSARRQAGSAGQTVILNFRPIR